MILLLHVLLFYKQIAKMNVNILCFRVKVLQTKAGGYATITTNSSKLFDFIEADDPVSKILLSGFTSHHHLFKDCGLFLALLCCKYDHSSVNFS